MGNGYQTHQLPAASLEEVSVLFEAEATDALGRREPVKLTAAQIAGLIAESGFELITGADNLTLATDRYLKITLPNGTVIALAIMTLP